MMEAILSRLQALSPEELRAEIVEAGIKCGPITSTTRGLFEKKLARAILEKHGGSSNSQDTDSGTSANPYNAEKADVEGNVGCSLRLNPQDEETSAGTITVAPCLDTTAGTTMEPPLVFYGVCPDEENEQDGNEEVHVYISKKEAMKAMVKMKGARFKIFSNREDAAKFSKRMFDSSPSSCKTSPDRSTEKPDRPAALEAESLNGERANNYKTPRTQDFTAKLRKAVEKGDQAAFKELVWSNPRYLIGSGDNPTIVQEGCRYNVMHVAAKENQPGIAQLLLDTLEEPEFMRLMYPDDQEAMLQKRIRYIVDLYLNTPDKAAFETPLHFACKFGCPQVVNLLCSHPETDKNCKNKYKQKPVDIICERNKCQEIKQKIKDYLEDRFYVPLLRAADNSAQPVIPDPWSAELLDRAPHWLRPGFTGSPRDPVMLVRAIVGPLSQSKAKEFRRMWKTPPRDRPAHFHHILKSDPDRGVERVGRELAHELGYPWTEYWEFLDTFVNLSTEDGLKLLEEYLSCKECSKQALQDTKKNRNAEWDGTAVTQEDDIQKNKQKNTLSSSPGPCSPHSLKEANFEKDHRDWLCSPLQRERGAKAKSLDQGQVSPVSNLMNEFEKVSVLQSGRRTEESSLGASESEETCSTSSDEYFTAAESDEEDVCHIARMTEAQSVFWDLKQKDLDSSSCSSSSSYKSLQCSQEDLMSNTPPSDKLTLFVDGESPTKLDCEVMFAISTVEIDAQKYPYIDRWKSTVQGYTSSQMQRWPSPGSVTKNLSSAPGSPTSPVLSCGSLSPTRHSPACYRPVHSNLIQSLYLNHF